MGRSIPRVGDDEITIAIGKRLRQARLGRGLSIAETAEMADIARQTLSDIERGRKDAKVSTLWRILDALRCDANPIMYDEDVAIDYDPAIAARVVAQAQATTDTTTPMPATMDTTTPMPPSGAQIVYEMVMLADGSTAFRPRVINDRG